MLKENWENKELSNGPDLEKLRKVDGSVSFLNKAGKVTAKNIIDGLKIDSKKTIVAVDFNIAGIEDGGEEIFDKLGNTVLGYKKTEEGRNFINIDHHIPIDEMKRKVSSTNLACDYVKKYGIMSKDDYEVVAHHADVDSFLATLVLTGVIPADNLVEKMAIIADHTGLDNALVDFLQASQEEDKEKNLDGEVNYKKTFKFLADNLAVLLEKVSWKDVCRMNSHELLTMLKDESKKMAVDQRLITNMEERISKRKEVKELVDNIDKIGVNSFHEIREGSGIFYVEVDREIDGELAPAVFADKGINANVIIISYPYDKKDPKRRVTKVRLGENGMNNGLDNGLDLQKINLNYFARGVDKNGKRLDTPGYGGRWNAGSDKRSGGTYLTGADYARNIDNLIKAQKNIVQFLEKLSNEIDIEEKDKNKITEAFKLMVELHISQNDRPDKKPYIVHPLEVAQRLQNEFGMKDSYVLIAALLHDSIEDQAKKLSKMSGLTGKDERENGLKFIADKYGTAVESLVRNLSNPEISDKEIETELAGMGITKTDEEFESEKNKLKNGHYFEHVKQIIEKDPKLLMIKLSDFSFNALALDNVKDPVRKAKLLAKYQPVAKLFLTIINNPNVEQKSFIDKIPKEKKDWLTEKLEELAKIKNIDELRMKLDDVSSQLTDIYHQIGRASGQNEYNFEEDSLGENELLRIKVGELTEYDDGPEWAVDWHYDYNWRMIMKFNEKDEYEFEVDNEDELNKEMYENFKEICMRLINK